MTVWESKWRCAKDAFLVKSIYDSLKAVEDPRSPRKKKHELAAILACLIAGYITGHTTLRRCLGWCNRNIDWLREEGLRLENGIASLSTVSRLLSTIDEELFLYAFIEWIGGIVRTKDAHLACDGKAMRAAAEKCKGKTAPMMLHIIEAKTGLVVAQLPIPDKESEITNLPKLLSFLDIEGSTITADALNTQTSVMEQIIEQGGHFVFMVKRNQPNSYEEIVTQFEAIKADKKRMDEDPAYKSMYPDYQEKYDEAAYSEKNRDRCEYRIYSIINNASFISKTENEWPFLKSAGCVEQIRIQIVKDEAGNDITPSKEQFLQQGSPRQPSPGKGDHEKDDIQVVGIISDKEMSAEEMGIYKRGHWCIENRLHHVLDDTFREDRSPAKSSRNNLALIRKYAYNILRLAMMREKNMPQVMTEVMDLFCDEKNLLGKYIFSEIPSLY